MGSVSHVSVQQLKNRTTAVLRRVEAGERVAVTKRGRVVATIEPATDGVAHPSEPVIKSGERSTTDSLSGRSQRPTRPPEASGVRAGADLPNRRGAQPSDSLYRRLQRRIEARTPGLRETSTMARQREFERISRKVARHTPYKSWREMDRAAKGDRLGLSR